jgi:NitT/TauT family transport system substrate-binding protein
MLRNILPYIWWLVLLFGLLGACALTLIEEEPLRLRVATWPGYSPLYAVDEHHLAAPTVLDVSTSELAQDNYRAFAEKRVDVLATTLYSAIQFHNQGIETVIFLITDYSCGADGIIARPGINQVSDLKGQRVGVESGSVSHFVLLRALEQIGLDETDVEIVHTGVSEAIPAIDQGRIDAAVVWEPMLSRHEQMNGLAPIFTSAAIPNEIVDVLVTHPEVLEQRPDDLVNLVHGWDIAVQQWHADVPEVRQSMAEGLNVDEADLIEQFMTVKLIDLEQNSQLLDLGTPESIEPTFEDMVQFLQSHDQRASAPPTPAELVNGQIVQAALARSDEQE